MIGDIAFRYVNYLLNLPGKSKQSVIDSGSHVTISDINASMLEVGKERAKDLQLPNELLSWKVEDAEKLSFKNDEFSAYTISFGIRNVTNIENASWFFFFILNSNIYFNFILYRFYPRLIVF